MASKMTDKEELDLYLFANEYTIDKRLKRLREIRAEGYAEGVKAALKVVRDREANLRARGAHLHPASEASSGASRLVMLARDIGDDIAALSVTPREAEEGKGS